MNWKDCECGCHGSELSVAKHYFWMDVLFLKKGYADVQFILKEGHGSLGNKIGIFDTMEEMNKKVVEILTKSLNEIQEVLKVDETHIGNGI